jgi:hypothetical protein
MLACAEAATLFGAVDNVQNLPTGSLLRRAYRVGVRFAF